MHATQIYLISASVLMPVCLNLSCRQMCVVLSEAPPPEEQCKQVTEMISKFIHVSEAAHSRTLL